MRLSSTTTIALAFALGACADKQAPVAPVDLVSKVPAGNVEVMVQEQPSTASGTQVFAVRVVANDVPLGAYQGSVHFAPGAFQLVSVETPQVDGEYHVVNSADFAKGTLRFAAYTTGHFTGNEAFRVTLKPLVSLADAHLQGALDVAGEVTGTPIASARLKQSQGIRKATGQLYTP